MSHERGTFSGLSARQWSSVLHSAECMELIAPGGVGRVGFASATGQEIIPVNFAMLDGDVVFRALSSGLLARLAGVRVGFEVDRIDDATKSGWSVLVQGTMIRITDRALLARGRNAVRAWAGGDRDSFMRIRPDRVSGRRVGPDEEVRR